MISYASHRAMSQLNPDLGKIVLVAKTSFPKDAKKRFEEIARLKKGMEDRKQKQR